jgi:hypothetical protein
MANTYSSTNLFNAREWQFDNMKEKFDQRREFTMVHKPFFEGQAQIPDLERIKAAYVQTTQVMYLPKKTFTVNNSKSCAPSGETASSGVATVSWNQYGFAIKQNKKQFQNNELTAIRALANDLFNAETTLWTGASGIEAAMVSYLNTNRTQVNKLSGTTGSKNTWKVTPNFYVETTNANRGQFWNYALHDMQLNNYDGKIWDIHNTWAGADINYYSAQGTANATNTQFQFAANLPAQFDMAPTNLINAATYHDGIHYLVPEGGVASLFWNDPLNRTGEESEAGKWYVMESMLHPGVWYDVFEKNSCSDTTDDGGTTQDSVTTWEFTINMGLTKQPMTGNETPIFKYQVLSS